MLYLANITQTVVTPNGRLVITAEYEWAAIDENDARQATVAEYMVSLRNALKAQIPAEIVTMPVREVERA